MLTCSLTFEVLDLNIYFFIPLDTCTALHFRVKYFTFYFTTHKTLVPHTVN